MEFEQIIDPLFYSNLDTTGEDPWAGMTMDDYMISDQLLFGSGVSAAQSNCSLPAYPPLNHATQNEIPLVKCNEPPALPAANSVIEAEVKLAEKRKPRKKTSPEEKEIKARERIMRNRQAAQDSRDKKKEYVANLEISNTTLAEQNSKLFETLKQADCEKSTLLSLVQALSSQLDWLKRNDASLTSSASIPFATTSESMPLSPESDSFTFVPLSPPNLYLSEPAVLRNTQSRAIRSTPYTPPTTYKNIVANRYDNSKVPRSPSASPRSPTLSSAGSESWSTLLVSEKKLLTPSSSASSMLINSDIATDALLTSLITSLSFLALRPASVLYARSIYKTTEATSNAASVAWRHVSPLARFAAPAAAPADHSSAALCQEGRPQPQLLGSVSGLRRMSGASRILRSLGKVATRGKFF